MPSKSTVHPFKYGMTEKIKHIGNVKKNKLKQQFLKSAKFTSWEEQNKNLDIIKVIKWT